MHLQSPEIKRIFKNLSYKYWVTTIRLKVYIKKYKSVLEMPYR